MLSSSPLLRLLSSRLLQAEQGICLALIPAVQLTSPDLADNPFDAEHVWEARGPSLDNEKSPVFFRVLLKVVNVPACDCAAATLPAMLMQSSKPSEQVSYCGMPGCASDSRILASRLKSSNCFQSVIRLSDNAFTATSLPSGVAACNSTFFAHASYLPAQEEVCMLSYSASRSTINYPVSHAIASSAYDVLHSIFAAQDIPR